MIAAYSEIHKRLTNAMCGQKVNILIVRIADTWKNHWVLKG
jgi:hypothetical protein